MQNETPLLFALKHCYLSLMKNLHHDSPHNEIFVIKIMASQNYMRKLVTKKK